MFERFTDRARRVVVLSQEEARLLHHNFIGTEHLLLGLIHEGEGVAAEALESLGVRLEPVREQVREIVGLGKQPLTGHIPFTPRAKKVLELSLREALQLGHNYIGTEHILLGLLREGEGVAAQVLVRLGADLKRVRQEVIRLIPGSVSDDPPAAAWQVPGRRERALMASFRGGLKEMEQRVAAAEERIGIGPDESSHDEEIARVVRARQTAAEAQEYENAAALRDTERELRAAQASRRAEWSAVNPTLPALAETVRQLSAEVRRLAALLDSPAAEPAGTSADLPAAGTEPPPGAPDRGSESGEGAA